jgi:ubiquinone/menaquinone biosynthesis C-methylase UbiE
MKTENQWSEYADTFASFDEYNHFMEDLFDLLGDVEGREILDLGCSNGLMCRLLASKGGHLTGIDISEHAIKTARTMSSDQWSDICYDVADANDLSMFQAATFNAVIAVNVLCSFGPDRISMRSIMKEIHRILVPGGALVAVLPHPAFEHRQKCVTRNRIFPEDYSYFKGGTPNTLKLKIGDTEGEFRNIHWTLEDYSQFFRDLFQIGDLREPEPDQKFDSLHPEMFGNGPKYPIYLLIRCVKS